jgi:hypothetical protein
LKSKVESFRGSELRSRGPCTLTIEAWRLEMEPKRVYRPVLVDSHHFDEELDPDPHKSEKLDPDPY